MLALSEDPIGVLITAQWRRDCLTAFLLGVEKDLMLRKLDQMRNQLEIQYACKRP